MRDIFLFYNIRSEIYSRTQSEFLCGTLFALKGMEQIKENQMNSYHYIKTFSKKFLLALLPVILLFAPTREIRCGELSGSLQDISAMADGRIEVLVLFEGNTPVLFSY